MTDLASPSPHFRLERLAEGITAAIATDDGFGLCNSGIIDLGDSTVVFDSMLTPQAADDLRRVAERLTGHPVAYLVNSHYHGDHIRGNGSFPSVRIVSTQKVRELIDERAAKALESDQRSAVTDIEDLRAGRLSAGPRDRRIFEGWFQGILATPRGLLIPLPDMFVEDRLVLRGTKRELWVMTFGGGHSPSDVLAYCPEKRIAFLGDLLSVGFHPSVGDGFPTEWIRILGSVRRLGVHWALPGHGSVGREGDIATLQDYLRALVRLANSARRQGQTRADLNSVPIPSEFSDWCFRLFFAENLARAFDLLPA